MTQQTLKPLLQLLADLHLGQAKRFITREVRESAALAVITEINSMIADDEPVFITERELKGLGFSQRGEEWIHGEGVYRLELGRLHFCRMIPSVA